MQDKPDQAHVQRTRNVTSGIVGFFMFVGLVVFAWTMGDSVDPVVSASVEAPESSPPEESTANAEDAAEEDAEAADTGAEDSGAEDSGAESEARAEETTAEVLPDPVPETSAAEAPEADAALTSGQLQEARGVFAAEAPVTALVLGDDTSDDTRKWVHLWARSLAEERAVSIAHWDSAPADYYPAVALSTDGAGGPLMIWNGSVAGGTARNAQQNLDGFVPESPDVVLLNFGRASTSGEFAAQMGALVDDIRGRYGDVPVLMVSQNPADEEADLEVRRAGEQWAEQADVGVLDVAAEFPAPDDDLPSEATSTSTEGQRLWAGYVTDVLE
ncbi:MAG: SGNH/GDSL hydrolase family protein [Ornithinimicrobium sp.]